MKPKSETSGFFSLFVPLFEMIGGPEPGASTIKLFTAVLNYKVSQAVTFPPKSNICGQAKWLRWVPIRSLSFMFYGFIQLCVVIR